jgi:hypothetical protein
LYFPCINDKLKDTAIIVYALKACRENSGVVLIFRNLDIREKWVSQYPLGPRAGLAFWRRRRSLEISGVVSPSPVYPAGGLAATPTVPFRPHPV